MTSSTFLDPGDNSFDASGATESTWQELGDLPYRRVRMYSDIIWGRKGQRTKSPNNNNPKAATYPDAAEENSNEERFGLSWYPKSYVDIVRAHQSAVLGTGEDSYDLARLLSTTTTTIVAGCPNGGPIAAVTTPLSTGGGTGGGGFGNVSTSGFGSRTTIRIMNNSGKLLAAIPFPPRDFSVFTGKQQIQMHRSPGDIIAMGFTSRCVLVVVLRDSLVLCYDLLGTRVLPPFFALNDRKGERNLGTGMDLLEARIFEGGVAVLGVDMTAAVVELLDEHDDPAYANEADVTSRRIVPLMPSQSDQSSLDRQEEKSSASASPFFLAPPPHYAIITPLPTAMYARSNHISFRCIAVLPRQYAPSCRPELFLSTSDGSVVVSELHPSTSPNGGLTDIDCRSKIGDTGGLGSIAPIVSMSFAPNGRFLACFTNNSILTVVSTTFESKVLEFSTSSGSSSPPRSMGWCGEDSVVLHWKNLGVLMVGPYGDWLRFSYGNDSGDIVHGDGDDASKRASQSNETEVYLVPEIDCCRVVTPTSVEILQRVPPGTADLLRIGSIEPGALLLDASDAFDSGSPNADEAARSITQQEGLLEEAIQGCIAAAVGEFDVKLQKRMLRAASYGLHFSCKDENSPGRNTGRPSAEAIAFVKAARKLRVLNAIRHPGTGWAMTAYQFDSVSPKGVVARLMASGKPSLASSVSEYLKLGRRVRDYARAMKAAAFVASCSTISGGNDVMNRRFLSMTDSQIAEEAIKIIKGEENEQGDISRKDEPNSTPPSPGMYASVALAAHRAGRKGVADLLIMLEDGHADKVHALLTIGSYVDAAAVAARARDPDLIYVCIDAFEQAFSKDDEGKGLFFSGVINKFPIEAVNVFTAYHARTGELGASDFKPLINILLRRQKHLEAGLQMAKRGSALNRTSSNYSTTDNDREKLKVESLTEASRLFELGGKVCAFQKLCTDEQLDLLADQEQLRTTYGAYEVAPPSSSVTSTIMSILKYAALEPRSAHRIFGDADKIAKKYKVPEKRLWHVKVRAFSESGQWPVLRNFADSRSKSPIGMKPFALAAIKGGQSEVEIMHYINRMQGQSDGEDRYDLFCEASLWKRALEEAVKLGDGRRIAHVRSVCNSPEIQRLCDKYIIG
ncbi:hypothetical protein ACHAXS_010017 [Conticribra weissflogii]